MQFVLSVNPNSYLSITDWTEVYVAINKITSKSEIKTLIESSTNNDVSETTMDRSWDEIKKRRKLYGRYPPFEIEYTNIERTIEWKNIPQYMTCLLLSILGNEYKTQFVGKLFEKIVSVAIKNFLGGISINYGSPRTRQIPNVKRISEMMHEEFREEPRGSGDKGLDVISWKPFDNRPNQIILILHCAAGGNWKSKRGELCINVWDDYINFAADPIRGIGLPLILSDADFIRSSQLCGLVIDRARIYKNTKYLTKEDKKLGKNLEKVCNAIIKKDVLRN